ncbi:MAG: hypothetical protein WKG32_19265, partial [Gemmatimonadaceae bacterium]
RTGARDDELIAMRQNVERDIVAGAPPAVAATVRARSIPALGAPRLPATTNANLGDHTANGGKPKGKP